MSGIPLFPKNKRDFARLIDSHVQRERAALCGQYGRAMMARWYLQGYRIFEARDAGGSVVWKYEFENRTDVGRGKRYPFRMGEMLSQINNTVGMLGGLDLMPQIDRKFSTLSALNEQAGARVLAVKAISEREVRRAQKMAALQAGMFGTVGLFPKVVDDPRIGLHAHYEVVNFRELVPFPSLGWNISDLRGFVRSKLVPLHIVKERYSGVPADLTKMETYRKRIGEEQDEHTTRINSELESGSDSQGLSDAEYYTSVMVNELFIEGADGLLEMFAATSGETQLVRQDLSEQPVYMCGSIIRFYETGGFHGAGLFDLIFQEVREFERMTDDLVRNAIEADKYPVALLPHGAIKEREANWNKGRQGMRYITIAPEASVQGDRPFNPSFWEPVNSGDRPQTVAAFLGGIIDRHSPVKNLAEEKGRIDNSLGIQQLLEDMNKSVVVPTQNFVDGFSDAHRFVLAETVMAVAMSPRPIPVNKMTLELVGAVIDREKGTINFQQNRLPNIANLKVGTRQESLTSDATQKQEAVELFALHQDLDRFIRYAVENDLNFAIDMEDERTAHDAIVNRILQLYQDGKTPGFITPNPHMVRADYQLQILNRFMASTEMDEASPEVQTFFIQFRMFLMSAAQVMLPQAVPDPYDQHMLTSIRNGMATGQIPPALQQLLLADQNQPEPMAAQQAGVPLNA